MCKSIEKHVLWKITSSYSTHPYSLDNLQTVLMKSVSTASYNINNELVLPISTSTDFTLKSWKPTHKNKVLTKGSLISLEFPISNTTALIQWCTEEMEAQTKRWVGTGTRKEATLPQWAQEPLSFSRLLGSMGVQGRLGGTGLCRQVLQPDT